MRLVLAALTALHTVAGGAAPREGDQRRPRHGDPRLRRVFDLAKELHALHEQHNHKADRHRQELAEVSTRRRLRHPESERDASKEDFHEDREMADLRLAQGRLHQRVASLEARLQGRRSAGRGEGRGLQNPITQAAKSIDAVDEELMEWGKHVRDGSVDIGEATVNGGGRVVEKGVAVSSRADDAAAEAWGVAVDATHDTGGTFADKMDEASDRGADNASSAGRKTGNGTDTVTDAASDAMAEASADVSESIGEAMGHDVDGKDKGKEKIKDEDKVWTPRTLNGFEARDDEGLESTAAERAGERRGAGGATLRKTRATASTAVGKREAAANAAGPAVGPAAAPSASPAPAPFVWTLVIGDGTGTMDENMGAPVQGFNELGEDSKIVQHDDGKTQTSDWDQEWSQADLTEEGRFKGICEDHPELIYCQLWLKDLARRNGPPPKPPIPITKIGWFNKKIADR